jgi:CO/xanthine dehydrogenase Mo-binding subunit
MTAAETGRLEFAWIGKALPRVDSVAKARGALVFPSDVAAEGMLHCRPVFAPHPHARLLAVRTEPAHAVPGVVRVLTSADVPGPNRYGYRRDHPVLCDDKTRHYGDMVAVVVAESEEAAAAGAALVEIAYEPLPIVADPETAMAADAPHVHDAGNILHQIHYSAGDTAAAFARPDAVVVEHTYRTQWMDHAFLETEAGVAFPEGDGVRVIAGGQNVWYDQEQVARCLALPLEKVHMQEAYTGGAFGGKGDITVQIVIALAARLTGRPCRMVWSREEHFVAGVKRHPYTIWMRTAADRQGHLLAQECRIISDTGAYAVFGDAILELTAENAVGLYRIPNVRLDAWAVYTNNPVCGAFRGFGATQGCLAMEGQMSALARALGMDQVELRRRNLLHQGDTAALGHRLLLPVAADDTLQAVAAHPLWRSRRQAEPAGSIRRGIGMALGVKGYSLGIGDAYDFAGADVELLPDGRIRLGLGIIDLGQGSFTALTQIAAEALRCEPAAFEVIAADTRCNLESGTTAASRVTYAVGRAVVSACQELAGKLRAAAAAMLRAPAERLELAGGVVFDPVSEQDVSFAELARRAPAPLRGAARLRVPFSEQPAAGGLAHPHVLYSSNAQIAQVAVDCDTGEVTVERVVAFPEAGQIINRAGLEGQCEGGVAQGVGYALMEQVLVREGRILNPDFAVYPIPTAEDVPAIETVPVEVPEATGPFGAKGAAENATLPTAPAILDAIEDAIGVRFTSLPVTPEQIVEALAATRRPASQTGEMENSL